MSKPYPTLSDAGWIHDAQQKIEWIFADYIASKHSQSDMFFGAVSSFSFDEFKGDYHASKAVSAIQLSLSQLYRPYFDDVDITVEDHSEADSHELHLVIRGYFTDNGKNYLLNETLSVHNGRVNRLAKLVRG